MDTTRPSLLIRVRDRTDGAAWQEFDGIYRPMIQRFAMARGLPFSDAEEITQQCMTAIQQHIGGFEYDTSRGRFKSWLATLVNNRVRNARRDRREYQPVTGELDALPEGGRAPDEVFDLLWRQEHLRHCLRLVRSEVSASTYEAFVAHVIEDRPIEDVCATLKMTRNQVQAIKSRVTRRIRAHMIELLGAEE